MFGIITEADATHGITPSHNIVIWRWFDAILTIPILRLNQIINHRLADNFDSFIKQLPIVSPTIAIHHQIIPIASFKYDLSPHSSVTHRLNQAFPIFSPIITHKTRLSNNIHFTSASNLRCTIFTMAFNGLRTLLRATLITRLSMRGYRYTATSAPRIRMSIRCKMLLPSYPWMCCSWMFPCLVDWQFCTHKAALLLVFPADVKCTADTRTPQRARVSP
jgi:hypothetical protein